MPTLSCPRARRVRGHLRATPRKTWDLDRIERRRRGSCGLDRTRLGCPSTERPADRPATGFEEGVIAIVVGEFELDRNKALKNRQAPPEHRSRSPESVEADNFLPLESPDRHS